MAITDAQHIRGLVDATSALHKRAQELRRRFDAYGLVPDELKGVPDEELMREVRNRGLAMPLNGECGDRCYRGTGPMWRFCTLPALHSGIHTDGAASWRAGHDGPEPVVHVQREVTE